MISGMATTAGAYSFTITATDHNNKTANQTYSGTIASFAITTTSLPTPVIGQSYNQTIGTANGTAPIGFAVTAGTLPAGLTLAPFTGVISGTPTTAGAYSFTIQATDANNNTAKSGLFRHDRSLQHHHDQFANARARPIVQSDHRDGERGVADHLPGLGRCFTSGAYVDRIDRGDLRHTDDARRL